MGRPLPGDPGSSQGPRGPAGRQAPLLPVNLPVSPGDSTPGRDPIGEGRPLCSVAAATRPAPGPPRGRFARAAAGEHGGAPPGPARSEAGNKSISPVHVWKRRTIPNALPHPCQILPTGFGPNVLQMFCKCPKTPFGQAAPKSSRKHLLNIWRVAEKFALLQKYLQNICSWGNFFGPRANILVPKQMFCKCLGPFSRPGHLQNICKTFAL